MKHVILCVDDEIDNADALERLFRRDYTVLKATSGAEALQLLKENDNIALILSDQRMPEMTGVQMLKQSIPLHPEAIRILLTGYTDIDSVIDSINAGHVYRYLTKPWDPVDLKNTVAKAIEKYDLRRKLVEKNQELEKALAELKTLDQAKNNFMILINHELKTPLTVLMSFLDLLKESSLNDEQKKYTSRIDKSANKLKSIIEDVLELVSAETGILKLHCKKVSTEKLLDGVQTQFISSANEKHQSFIFDIDKAFVKVDLQVIHNVFSRLIDNAVKFGKNNSIIEISVKTQKDNNLLFSVSNEGKALKPETIDKILKPFALDENIMNHTQGLGVGLSLAQALLKSHNSKLSIECPKNKFIVAFKLKSQA